MLAQVRCAVAWSSVTAMLVGYGRFAPPDIILYGAGGAVIALATLYIWLAYSLR